METHHHHQHQKNTENDVQKQQHQIEEEVAPPPPQLRQQENTELDQIASSSPQSSTPSSPSQEFSFTISLHHSTLFPSDNSKNPPNSSSLALDLSLLSSFLLICVSFSNLQLQSCYYHISLFVIRFCNLFSSP